MAPRSVPPSAHVRDSRPDPSERADGPRPIGRRAVLAGAVGAGLTAGLVGCAPEAATGKGDTGEVASSGVELPTYTPYGDVTPDLPGDPTQGIPAAYFHYPEITEMEGIPLPQTEPYSFLAQGTVTGEPKPGNPWYDKFAEDMGNQFNLISGGWAEYRDKFAVTIAGDDLPDLVMIEQVPQLPRLLEAKFHDLSPYLSGDNVQQYAGLASLPTAVWGVSSLAGGLWGVTRPTVALSGQINVWSDDMEELGLDPDPAPADGAEYLEMLKTMTSDGKFALGADPVITVLGPSLMMCGAPNEWRRNEDGSFTHAFETDEYLRALEVSAEIWAAGVLHPDSITNPDAKSGWFNEGITRGLYQGFSAYGYTTVNHRTRRLSHIQLPKWDGGGAADPFRGAGGYPSFTAISKTASEDRVRELLEIMNYIAAPFGTRQFLTGEYGVEGVHYTLDGNDPVNIPETRSKDMLSGLGYAGRQSLYDVYVPGYDDVAERMHAMAADSLPRSVPDDSRGLFSETWASKSTTLLPRIKDLQLAIIRGREKPSAWTELIESKWLPEVGDPSRDELQAADQEEH